MNYEQLLDEIMVNTISANQLVGYPQKDFHYAVCPRTIEFHTSIFLSSALLCLNQKKPLIILVQVDNLEKDAMLYTWTIGPHFWRTRDLKKNAMTIEGTGKIPFTDKNYYPYLDKLFCYLSVINVNQNHLVLFIKKGEKKTILANDLKKLLKNDYSLLVISNCYENLPINTCKEESNTLITHLKNKSMESTEKENFPAFSILSEILPKQENPNHIEQLINSWEIGFDNKKTTSLFFMLS